MLDALRTTLEEAPSMKVPPKRKGNVSGANISGGGFAALNESPSEKEGKWICKAFTTANVQALNESPSEKEGKCGACELESASYNPQ